MKPLLVLMAASGQDQELRLLAERSLGRCGYPVDLRVLSGSNSHGEKLDYGKQMADKAEIVVTMDSDCVVFPGWGEWITQTLANPMIGACGAPAVDKPGLHPSMLAMRGFDYVASPSLQPTAEHDTGGAVCAWLESRGLYLQGITAYRLRGELEDWWRYSAGAEELWWHLGSGSQYRQPASDAERALWQQAADEDGPDARWFRKNLAFLPRYAQFIKAASQKIG